MTDNGTNIEAVTHQPYEVAYKILDGKFTKTTHFLLPGLHLSIDMKLFTLYFANAFLNDEYIEHILKNPIFILFKVKVFDEKWKLFEKSLRRTQRFVHEYNVGKHDDDYLVMFSFEFPPAYRADYFRFLEGEYSKFSDHFKRLFKETTPNDYGKIVENPLYGVVHKTENLRKQLERIICDPKEPNEKINSEELWERWSPEREIFRKKTKLNQDDTK